MPVPPQRPRRVAVLGTDGRRGAAVRRGGECSTCLLVKERASSRSRPQGWLGEDAAVGGVLGPFSGP